MNEPRCARNLQTSLLGLLLANFNNFSMTHYQIMSFLMSSTFIPALGACTH